jgi:uncharacterized protein (TIGR00251 family)
MKIKENNEAVIFPVKVIPRASKSGIVGEFDGALKVKLSSPPVEGAANKELVKLLSKALKVAKNKIEIIKGETSRSKTVRVYGVGKKAILDLS